MYLDTTVILDFVDKRNESTMRMLDTIKVNNLGVLISPFGILEVIDAKKTDRWTEYMLERGFSVVQIARRMGARRTGRQSLSSNQLNEVYASIHEVLEGELSIVGVPAPAIGLMNQAEDICASTNLAAADSLHLATALYYDCQLLVSSDSDLIKIAGTYISATSPEGFHNRLDSLLGAVI